MKDSLGNILTSRIDIENPLLSSLSDDKNDLIKPVPKGMVFRTLRSMPRGKSSGSDGFNVDFYLFIGMILEVTFLKLSPTFLKRPKSLPLEIKLLLPLSLKMIILKRPWIFALSLYVLFVTKSFPKFLLRDLKKVLPKLIGPKQSSFLGDRFTLVTSLLFKKLFTRLKLIRPSP